MGDLGFIEFQNIAWETLENSGWKEMRLSPEARLYFLSASREMGDHL